MISFKKVCKRYDDHIVFDTLNLDIESGDFVTIVGPSGCGKSTLIRMLIGYDAPTSGKVVVDDFRVSDMDPGMLQFYRRKIGVVFQDYKLLPKKTVYENVAFAMEVCGEPDSIIERRVLEVLETVGLESKLNHFPKELSGGEQQRVAIARALVHKPRLLIADEPTGNLDIDNSYGIMRLLLDINKTGTTVIVTTHSRDMINFVNKRVVVLEDGAIAYDGKKSGLKTNK